jgi:DNA-binding response OmpR family regulator
LAHLLLIDDDPVQLSTREAVLRHAGFAVSIATTADGAIALMRTEPLASSLRVIITDHVMPGATGAEFVRTLRTINTTVPVIVVSGLPEIESEYEGLNVRFLPKPCFPQQLIGTVKECLSESAGRGRDN